MAGFPFSGKTYVVEKLDKALGDSALVISPKFLFPPDYDDLDDNQKTETNIVSWRCSLDQLEASFDMNNHEVIIYDTCCASFDAMEYYFRRALDKGHRVVLLYVYAHLDICAKRAGDKWFDSDVIEKYKSNFKTNLPRFVEISNKWFRIDNIEEPDLRDVIEYIRSDGDGEH